MVGSRRVTGSVRALSSCSRALFWAIAAGTVLASCAPGTGISIDDDVGVGAFSGSSSVFGTAGDGPACQPSTTPTPVFADEVFRGPLVSALDFYVWVPAAQVTSLRADKKLFGPSQDVSSSEPLSTLGLLSFADPSGPAFATALQAQFKSGRYAWPQPWANRMLESDPNAELVHVTLRPEAWLAVIQENTVVVYDETRARVSFADAFAHPERIGAIYFDSSETACSSGGTGDIERGFLIGNEALVQEWSLRTPEILARLQKDIQDLTQFLIETRSCPTSIDQGSWSQMTPCEWQGIFADGSTPLPISSAGAPSIPDSGSSGAGADLAGAAGADDGGANNSGGASASGGGGASNSGGGGAAPSSGGTSATLGVAGADAGIFTSPLALQNGTEEYAYIAALVEADADYFPQPAQIGAIIDTLQGDVFEPDPLIVTPGSP